jgi:hypothetical protein
MQHAITAAIPFSDVDLKSTGRPRGRSIHKIPVSFSAAYFSAALVTDLVYWQMPNVMWERFSISQVGEKWTDRHGRASSATRLPSCSR